MPADLIAKFKTLCEENGVGPEGSFGHKVWSDLAEPDLETWARKAVELLTAAGVKFAEDTDYRELINKPAENEPDRGDCIFPKTHSAVMDDRDHYPINTEEQAKSALDRAAQQVKPPAWFSGEIEDLRKIIVCAVKEKFPDISMKMETWKKYAHISTYDELRSILEAKLAERYDSDDDFPQYYLVDILLDERAIIAKTPDGEFVEIPYDLTVDGEIELLEEIPVRKQWISQYAVEIKTVDIPGVEIFAAGTTETPEFTEADIKAMAEAANELKDEVKSPVFTGHTREHGWPAFGWVENVRAAGNKLVGDLKKVPETIAAWVKSGGFRRVSAEIWPNYKSENGKTYPHVLCGLALLGQDIPRCRILDDLPIPAYSKKADLNVYTFGSNELSLLDTPKSLTDGGEPKMPEKNEMIQLDPKRYAELLEMEKKAIALEDQAEKIKQFTDEVESLKSKIADLEKSNEAKTKEFADYREGIRVAKISSAIEQLKSSGRIKPADENKVRSFAESLSDSKTLKYGEGEEAVETSQLDSYLADLFAIPEGSAVKFGVISRKGGEPNEPGGGGSEKFDREVKSYMKKNDVSYKVAAQAVTKEKPELAEFFND